MQLAASLDRILRARDQLGTRFYAHLLGRHPHLSHFFTKVNLRRQAIVATMSLTVIEQFYRHEYEATRLFLHYLGARHRDLRVPREEYPNWKEAMLATLAEFNAEHWTPELADVWSRAIDKAIAAMMVGYDEGFDL